MILVEVSEYVLINMDKVRAVFEKKTGFSFHGHTPSELISLMVEDYIKKLEEK